MGLAIVPLRSLFAGGIAYAAKRGKTHVSLAIHKMKVQMTIRRLLCKKLKNRSPI